MADTIPLIVFLINKKKILKNRYQSEYGNDTEGGYDIGKESKFEAPTNYDDRLDHMIVFFNAIRTGSKIYEDASFGLRAAAPAIACNLSAPTKQTYFVGSDWNETSLITFCLLTRI